MGLDIFVVTYRSEAYVKTLKEDLRTLSTLPHFLHMIDNTGNPKTLTGAWNDLWMGGQEEFSCFLNPDIRLCPGWDDRLVSCLKTHPDIAIAMGNRYFPSDRPEGPSQELVSRLALESPPNFKYLGEHLEGFYAVVIRRAALVALRGFDERFRFYFQDSDFQLRCLKRLGLHTVQVEHCPIWHFGWGSTREAEARGEIDRAEESRHAERTKAVVALKEWQDLTDAERAAVRLDPVYGKIPRKA